MRYRLIGIDLDGTLLGRDGKVSDANRAAIDRARGAGALVVPCTGRGWRESLSPLKQLDSSGPGVFITGASVADTRSGEALDLAVIEPHLALEIVGYLHDQPEAVLVFHDEARVGYDYLVTGKGALSPNTQWWFGRTGATVHYQQVVTADDLHHALRVCVVATEERVREMTNHLRRHMDGRIFFHSFQAVQLPEPSECLHILEIFAPGVDKWRGLSWIAQSRGVPPEEIAVIGDEINDVRMIASAGCGIAMGNAIDSAKAVANHVTRDCDQSGVAHAIEQLLCGAWG